MASNADKQQLARIKSIFEKKNQKSAVSISQLQKKLEGYQKRIKELETHGLTTSHHLKQPKEMLRDVGHGLRYNFKLIKLQNIFILKYYIIISNIFNLGMLVVI